MGLAAIILSGAAVLLTYVAGYSVLSLVSAIATVGCLISFVTMLGYARAEHRATSTRGFLDLTEREIQAVPDWITWIFMAFLLMGAVLFIVGIVLNVMHPSTGSNWLVLVVLYPLLFVGWGHLCGATILRLELFPRWKWMNPIGRPFLTTIVLTGFPALYAQLTRLPLRAESPYKGCPKLPLKIDR